MFWKKRKKPSEKYEKLESDRFRQHAEFELKACGYDALFQDEQGEAVPPNFANLWLLREAVMTSRPSLVLEYGSGYSTYLFAKTLRELGGGHVISVELGSPSGAGNRRPAYA